LCNNNKNIFLYTHSQISRHYDGVLYENKKQRKAWGAPNLSRDARQRRNANPPSPKKRSTREKKGGASRESFRDFALRPANGKKNRVDRLKDKLFYLQIQRDEWCRKVRGLDDYDGDEEKSDTLLRKYEKSLDDIDSEYQRNERRRRFRSSSRKNSTTTRESKRGEYLPVTHRTAGIVFAALKRASKGDERKLLRSLRDLSGELEDADNRANGRFTGMLKMNSMSTVLRSCASWLGFSSAECDAIAADACSSSSEGQDVDYVDFMDRVFEVRELKRNDVIGEDDDEITKKKKTLLRSMRRGGGGKDDESPKQSLQISTTTTTTTHRAKWTKEPTIPRPFPGLAKHLEDFESRVEAHREAQSKRMDDEIEQEENVEPFRAREIPRSTFEPRYERIEKEQRAHREELRRQRELFHERKSQPFEGIQERDARMREKREKRMLRHEKEREEAVHQEREDQRRQRHAAAAERRRNARISYVSIYIYQLAPNLINSLSLSLSLSHTHTHTHKINNTGTMNS